MTYGCFCLDCLSVTRTRGRFLIDSRPPRSLLLLAVPLLQGLVWSPPPLAGLPRRKASGVRAAFAEAEDDVEDGVDDDAADDVGRGAGSAAAAAPAEGVGAGDGAAASSSAAGPAGVPAGVPAAAADAAAADLPLSDANADAVALKLQRVVSLPMGAARAAAELRRFTGSSKDRLKLRALLQREWSVEQSRRVLAFVDAVPLASIDQAWVRAHTCVTWYNTSPGYAHEADAADGADEDGDDSNSDDAGADDGYGGLAAAGWARTRRSRRPPPRLHRAPQQPMLPRTPSLLRRLLLQARKPRRPKHTSGSTARTAAT